MKRAVLNIPYVTVAGITRTSTGGSAHRFPYWTSKSTSTGWSRAGPLLAHRVGDTARAFSDPETNSPDPAANPALSTVGMYVEQSA